MLVFVSMPWWGSLVMVMFIGLLLIALIDAVYAGYAPYRARESWSKCW